MCAFVCACACVCVHVRACGAREEEGSGVVRGIERENCTVCRTGAIPF